MCHYNSLSIRIVLPNLLYLIPPPLHTHTHTQRHPLLLPNKMCNGIQEDPANHRYSHLLVKRWLRLCCLNCGFVFILCAVRFYVLYDLLKFQDRWWILSKVILCDILYKVDPNLDPDLPEKRAL